MFKKKKSTVLVAPITGEVFPVSECVDGVFAQKILGDGIFVAPEVGVQTVCSPVSGKIINTVDSLHAYGIESDDGLEILVHIGINTVELGGEGFESLVEVGNKVKAGSPLCRVDFGLLSEKGYSLQTPLVITDMSIVDSITVHTGPAVSSETSVLEYAKK